MKYRYIREHKFWDVYYHLNDIKFGNRMFISSWRFGSLMPPEIMPELLKAELCCEPIRGKDRGGFERD